MRSWASSSSSARCRRTWWSARATRTPRFTRPTTSWCRRRCSGRTTTTSRSCVRLSATKRWSPATGSYNNLLPNLDFDIGLTDALKARFSYSKTIARAGYFNLSAGQIPGDAGRFDAGRRLHAAGRTEQPGAAAARVRQLRRVARVLLLGQGIRVARCVPEERRELHRQHGGQTINLYGIRNQTGRSARADRRSTTCTSPAHPFPVDDSALFTAVAMLENPGTFTDAKGVSWTGGLRQLQRQQRATRGVRDQVRHPADGRRSAVHVRREHADQQQGSQDPWLRVRRAVLLRRHRLRRAGQLHRGAWRRRLRRDQRPERKPVRVARPVGFRQRGADVREVRLLGASRLQLARRVPAEPQRRASGATRSSWRPTTRSI